MIDDLLIVDQCGRRATRRELDLPNANVHFVGYEAAPDRVYARA